MMTAMWASPIVAQDLLAGRRCARARTVGSSSSIRCEGRRPSCRGRPWSAARWRPAATAPGTRAAAGAAASPSTTSVSPVSVTASLATAPISPALSSPIGSCSLPWSSSSWPIRSSSPRVGVPDVGLRLERARQDAQVGQPPDERVGGGLEDAHEQRPGLVRRRPRPSAPALSVGLDRRLVGRGGEVADDRVEQAAQADALGRAADQDRREDRCP